MRNRYPGTCYRCGQHVAPYDGHFERFRGGWRTQHATCAINHRGTPDPEHQADQLAMHQRRATETGERARRSRKWLRDHAQVQQ